MPQHILNNIFIDFLNCEYNAYLKLEGKFRQKSEYEKLHGHLSQEYRIHACKNYSSLISENKISATEIPISELLKKRLDVGINIKTEINGFNLFFELGNTKFL